MKRPFKALLIFALVSSECLKFKELPAIFNMLYCGFNLSKKNCSLLSKSDLSQYPDLGSGKFK
jgi:hypothetical protein